jgi:hypothetical protein
MRIESQQRFLDTNTNNAQQLLFLYRNERQRLPEVEEQKPLISIISINLYRYSDNYLFSALIRT